MYVGAQLYYKVKGDIKSRLPIIKRGYIIFAVIVSIIMVSSPVPYIATVILKHGHDSHCRDILPVHVPTLYETLIAKNSTTILLNTTDALDQLLSCHEPTLEIVATFPMSIYLVVCENLQYTNYLLADHTSIMFLNASNPLPTAFDERYPNYLVNGNINVTINVSVSKPNSLTPEYIYFCSYTDYNQFQNFISKSTKSYWKNYGGRQCNEKQFSKDNAFILKRMFSITQPDYVFVGFGSTVDLLDSFQFTISVSGQMISDPGQPSLDNFIEQSCNLGDRQHSCKLNLARNSSESMCIVGSRPVDLVSPEPFGSLVIKWSTIKPYDKANKITFGIMIAFFGSGSMIIVCLCLLQASTCYKKRKSVCNTQQLVCEEVNVDS